MKEGWEKENIEKSKRVLKEHFKKREMERMWKEMAIHISLPIQFHVFSSFEVDDEELDDFSERKKVFDDFIWKKLDGDIYK